MKILDNIQHQQLSLTLNAGEKEHYVLLNPEDVQVNVIQKAGSSFTLHLITLSGADTHCEICVDQQEIGCETHLLGLGILRGKQQAHTITRVTHSYPNAGGRTQGGFSDQLFKYVLNDEAQGSFFGELKVLTDAQKTEAHQTNRNILISPTAKMTTKPQLEIYADDVKCSHGASTGQLDQQALFYMQQRGISLSSARRLLLAAFLAEVINALPEDLRDSISQQIETLL